MLPTVAEVVATVYQHLGAPTLEKGTSFLGLLGYSSIRAMADTM